MRFSEFSKLSKLSKLASLLAKCRLIYNNKYDVISIYRNLWPILKKRFYQKKIEKIGNYSNQMASTWRNERKWKMKEKMRKQMTWYRTHHLGVYQLFSLFSHAPCNCLLLFKLFCRLKCKFCIVILYCKFFVCLARPHHQCYEGVVKTVALAR